ncbi:BMC domain-containing protein [Paenibacillus doosanensis]|uniref:BMC domain-containing protein n=1 Tax=Paenibacillus doosanensis TaxID=1229154 RepID=UPI0021804371|nr:BMC domain-containing protein [Paenibacillus doosanensis]MCS7464593.1 BMC domain-containing protein [Paenibacillus doosanensis]
MSLWNGLALGMIETLGIPALIAAADAAAKTADVRVTTFEKADAGIVTIYIVGDVASVKAAVEAGEAQARRVGRLLSTHVIPRPDASVYAMLAKQWPEKLEVESAEAAQDTPNADGAAAAEKPDTGHRSSGGSDDLSGGHDQEE